MPLEIALFRDATEIAWRLADHLETAGLGPPTPRRRFVRDADEAHRLCLDGIVPVVGMSLDDVLDCALSGHPAAGDVVAFHGVHRGFLSLVARPEVSGLAGRKVAVDTWSGYASALFEMLGREGLDWRRDLQVVLAGATDRRYGTLLAGDFDATLLGSPFDLLAETHGCHRLASVLESLGGYQAVVFAAHRPWLQARPEEARGLAAAFEGALAWARDPAHREEVAGIVRASLPEEPGPETLQAIVDRLFGPGSEFCVDGRIAPADAAVVGELSARHRGAAVPLEQVLFRG